MQCFELKVCSCVIQFHICDIGNNSFSALYWVVLFRLGQFQYAVIHLIELFISFYLVVHRYLTSCLYGLVLCVILYRFLQSCFITINYSNKYLLYVSVNQTIDIISYQTCDHTFHVALNKWLHYDVPYIAQQLGNSENNIAFVFTMLPVAIDESIH